MEKTGRLEYAVELPGWGRDLQINVGGEVFFKRLGTPGDRPDLSKLVFRQVRVVYEQKTTPLKDLIYDKIFGGSYGIPRTYNEIICVSSFLEEDFSREHLEGRLKQAVEAEDYKTAAELKKQIQQLDQKQQAQLKDKQA